MVERLDADQEEAFVMQHLIQAWTAAQDIVQHLQPLMRELGLLKEDGQIDTDRVLLIAKKAKGE